MTVMDEDCEGCPISVLTEGVTIVKKLLFLDGHNYIASVKQLSSDTVISIGSIELVVHDYLNM